MDRISYVADWRAVQDAYARTAGRCLAIARVAHCAGHVAGERNGPPDASPRGVLPQYLVAHLLELLATDPRTNLLDARVRVVGNRVFLAGTVESARLRTLAEDVVREAIPSTMEIVNELCLVTYAP